MNTTPLTISNGTWYTRENGGAYEIINSETDEALALVNEPGDAAILSCAKEMLESLITIQETMTAEFINDQPIPKRILEPNDINKIIETVNETFAKIANEVPS